MTTDVLIIGAGPTGLMAANQLQRFGVDFIIVDSKAGPTVESRALAVSARSMELYQQLGLADTVLERAVKINGFHVYSNGKRKTSAVFDDIGEDLSDFPYMMVVFEQNKNETILYENLQAHNKTVMWNTSFIKLTEHADYVEAKVKTEAGEETIRAKHIIGCDGARSPVRHQKDFSFEGGTYENKFYVADVHLSNDFDSRKLMLAPSDETFTAIFPMKGDNKFRLVGTLLPQYADKEDITFEDIKAEVSRCSRMKLEYEGVNWFSIYKLHHRCVDNFSKGRVHLAGDSAHIHSPAGGQGMNTGLQDAHNLAWKLAYHLKGYANADLLDTYNEERLPFAKWLLGFTDRGFTLMSGSGWFISRFRKYVMLNVMRLLFSTQNIKPRLFKTFSQTSYDYTKSSLSASDATQKLKFKAGERLPYIEPNFYLHFSAAQFHILHIAKQNLAPETAANIQATFPFPVNIVEQKLSPAWQKLGVRSELFILVRPDTYIAYMADTFNESTWKTYLERYFLSSE